MASKTYGIGELARLSGMPIRRIRFYSDRGLLPPSGRTDGNYRLYTNEDLARLDLIRALRAAGVELPLIARVVARRLPLAEVLGARLEILEREVSAKLRTANAIRATLSLPSPTESDFRRLLTMMTLTNAEMQAKAREFVNFIAEGTTLDEKNRQSLLGYCTCELPENPSAEQMEAWEEVSMLLDNEILRTIDRENLHELFGERVHMTIIQAFFAEFNQLMAPVKNAGSSPIPPDSQQAKDILQTYFRLEAMTWGHNPDKVLERYIFTYENKNLRTRFRKACELLQGKTYRDQPSDVWDWLYAAMISVRNETSKGSPIM